MRGKVLRHTVQKQTLMARVANVSLSYNCTSDMLNIFSGGYLADFPPFTDVLGSYYGAPVFLVRRDNSFMDKMLYASVAGIPLLVLYILSMKQHAYYLHVHTYFGTMD